MWPEVNQAKSENKREIKLSGAEISERITAKGLDSSIFALDALNLLNISETALTTIPDDLAKLGNLQTLLLYDNQITAVPAAIGQLDKLKVLDLSRNRITELPDSITQLLNLTTINVSHNQLQTIPALHGFAKLSVLNASHNQLTQFPDICVEDNRNLAEILLMDNGIGAIPHAIEQLVSLKQLSMVRNRVKTIPKSLATITKLKGRPAPHNFFFFTLFGHRILGGTHFRPTTFCNWKLTPMGVGTSFPIPHTHTHRLGAGRESD